ncbi:MAG: DUF4124 domain-containing protein [Burkholderiales bacterium]|nr:DUF4124 domain-containing protein [Burkholderiales bacterium]
MKRHTFALLLISAAFAGATGAAHAQTIYRIVGSDGKVTFSDKPPVSVDQGKVAGTGVGAAGAASSSGLPFELRQVASKYPVTLYTSPDCAPCSAGRSLLMSRGVPFSERTVVTGDDGAALQRLTGDSSIPVLAIGSQRIKGYSDVEWTSYLDAAGYPKASMMPSGYRNPPPAPLVTVQKPAEPKPEAPVAPSAEPVAPPPSPSNPAGISF